MIGRGLDWDDEMKLSDLFTGWRDEAELYRKRGQEPMAAMLESLAADLEEFCRRRDLEELTISEAATESGLSYSSIQKKVAAGELPNVGRKNRPRIQRTDLELVNDVLAARRQAS